MQALAEAGGPSLTADQSQAILVRGDRTTKVSLKPTAGPQFMVQPGDIIYLERAPRISVGGAVNTPDLQFLTQGDTTVWDAIVACGGPKPEAALSRVKLARFAQAGEARILDLQRGPDHRMPGLCWAMVMSSPCLNKEYSLSGWVKTRPRPRPTAALSQSQDLRGCCKS